MRHRQIERERMEHTAALTANGFTVSEVEDLLRNAKGLHSIAEAWCCEEMTDEQRERVERREASLERNIRKIVSDRNARCGGDRVFVKFDGDPRGYTVKLHLPDGRHNTWGGEAVGWGIG